MSNLYFRRHCFNFFFFFNDTATTEIYTLSLHDALPISCAWCSTRARCYPIRCRRRRSEEHTSELQSHVNLVCRLLLEKKKKTCMSSTATKTAHARPQSTTLLRLK